MKKITVKPRKALTLVLGLEHFIDKIGYHKLAMDLLGEESLYLVDDMSGMSRRLAKKYNAEILIVSKNPIVRLYYAAREIFRLRPKYIEIYHTGILSGMYAWLGAVAGATTILTLRGQEFSFGSDIQARLKNLARNAALKRAEIILVKEKNLEDEVTRRGYKCKTISNCVPLPGSLSPLASRDNDVLYMNSIRPERHVLDIIRAAEMLFEDGETFRVSIIGFSLLGAGHATFARDYERQCLEAIETSRFRERFTIGEFTDKPSDTLDLAKIFLFPADIVFANYSLLEAMAHGCVPIVYPGEGHDRIVSHLANGFVADGNANSLADALRAALADMARLQELSRNARVTIEQRFSIATWAADYKNARCFRSQYSGRSM